MRCLVHTITFIASLCASSKPGSSSQPKSFGDGTARFISRNVWDPRISEEVRKMYSPGMSKAQGPCSRVVVKSIPAGCSHPAAGQYGLFAAATLYPGEHILDYLGHVKTEDLATSSCADSEYVAALAPGILVDAEKEGTEARFINDFHGTGKMPNVRFERRVDENGEHRLGVHVMKRKIAKGEELLITYGWGYALG